MRILTLAMLKMQSRVAAMMLGCDEASRQGLIVSNVEKLILKNVNIEGCDGEAIVADNVDTIERD